MELAVARVELALARRKRHKYLFIIEGLSQKVRKKDLSGIAPFLYAKLHLVKLE